MEKYKSDKTHRIVNISRSGLDVGLRDHLPKSVMYSLTPFLILGKEDKLATIILRFCFFDESKEALSNELTVQVKFEFNGELPVVEDNEGNFRVSNYDDLISIFDTAIGIFRGVVFEWLRNTELQHPFPFINVEEFIKEVNVSFSK